MIMKMKLVQLYHLELIILFLYMLFLKKYLEEDKAYLIKICYKQYSYQYLHKNIKCQNINN